MNIKEQVCTLEQAIKLKELGVKMESYLIWYLTPLHKTTQGIYQRHSCIELGSGEYPAFTTTELGAMMPKGIEIPGRWGGKLQTFGSWKRNDNLWFCWYAPGIREESYKDDEYICRATSYNEAEARADVLIYLIENNLIPLP